MKKHFAVWLGFLGTNFPPVLVLLNVKYLYPWNSVTSFWAAKSNCHLFEIFLWAFMWLLHFFCLYSFIYCLWHFFFFFFPSSKTLLNLSALLGARQKTKNCNWSFTALCWLLQCSRKGFHPPHWAERGIVGSCVERQTVEFASQMQKSARE